MIAVVPKAKAPSRPLRVSFLSFDFGEYSIRLASALAERCTVQLLLPHAHTEGHRHLLDESVTLHQFTKPRLRQPIRQQQMARELRHAISTFRPDVVHIQQGHFWFNFALPFLRQYPLVITVHDPKPHVGDRDGQKTPAAITRFGFRRADYLIAHGEQMADEIERDCGIRREHIEIVPHVALGQEIDDVIDEEDGLILFLGRIWEYKGLDYLIRAQPIINQHVPHARFVIAGTGEDFERYRRLMHDPERFIVRNEYISDEEREEWLHRASVVVLPYIDATQSGVIPLAFSAGKPVVATTVGSLPEQVTDGETGYLVPPRDEQALAEAVVRLLTDHSLRAAMGENARRKVEADWSPGRIAAHTHEIYLRAIADRLNRKASRA